MTSKNPKCEALMSFFYEGKVVEKGTKLKIPGDLARRFAGTGRVRLLEEVERGPVGTAGFSTREDDVETESPEDGGGSRKPRRSSSASG